MTESKETTVTEGQKNIPLIFPKLINIMRNVGTISKDRKNTAQKYSFRGIDDVYCALHDVLAKEGIITIPTVLEERAEAYKSSSGKTLIYRILKIQYRFCAEDGSSIDATVIGEGMDWSDKAANKAMSVAHKYALLQIFLIPTDDPKDPENESHQLNGKPRHVKDEFTDEEIASQSISDMATNPDESAEEREKLAGWIKMYLESKTIDYKAFKQFLDETTWKPVRKFVGKQFGNLSLSEGKFADLQYLKNNIDKCIDKFIEKQVEK